jgi:branched-chain amino acid transport system ATP-binding protein
MLEVEGLASGYGDAQVLFGVDLFVRAGDVVALMGRNGMGKTTTVRAVMGLLPAWKGSIRFDGRELAGLPPFRIAQAGLGLVPEGRQVFPTLSVEENLVATAASRRVQRAGPLAPSTGSFPASPSVGATWATSFPGASSRCSPSGGP